MEPPSSGVSGFAATDPERLAFVAGGRRVTYGELDERTTRLAVVLRDLGVGAGDRVAIMLPNDVAFFEVWAAAAKLEAAVVLVNFHLKADELAYILEDSQARVLVAHERLRPAFAPAVARTGCTVIEVGGEPDEYETVIARGAPDANALAAADLVSCEVLATPVFYTSGTTGRPKGVVHGSLAAGRAVAAQQGQIALWQWTERDVYILSGPAYHAGPGGYVMSALFIGARCVIMQPGETGAWDAREWLRLVAQERVTISFMTPAHFIRILEVPEAERAAFDLSSLRVIVHGGAPCPVPVKERILDALAPAEVWELYGASEGGATRISPSEWRERPGSVGTPWPGVEVRVLDDSGRAQPAGATGLVYIRPAGGARFHYHDDPEKTESVWSDDAFTVGDVGHLDADGYLYLTDRASDMVIRGGVNIYPREIEDVLFTHPAVVDCAVFGVPDERLGERLHAVIETRAPVTDAELDAFCRARVADYKVPASWELVAELPRHPNGKVLKRLLREQAWTGRETQIG
ncbi:MAG: long-chain acyl-CoA synthetase [Actinomycetota bacterium]|jgi:long-chain acyl-CoA synthetase|nr:long-chain acyl-CoA synthetase [Actinomycetota bacterium]